MSRHIVLPGENWADFRDGTDVTEKHRRKILAKNADLARVVQAAQAATANGEDPERVISADELLGVEAAQDALIVALVSGWSYDLPIVEDSLLELPGKAYDTLKNEAAPEISKILPDFSASKDTDSPSGPSEE